MGQAPLEDDVDAICDMLCLDATLSRRWRDLAPPSRRRSSIPEPGRPAWGG